MESVFYHIYVTSMHFYCVINRIRCDACLHIGYEDAFKDKERASQSSLNYIELCTVNTPEESTNWQPKKGS